MAGKFQGTMKNYYCILICIFFAALSTPIYSNGMPMKVKTDAAIFVIGDSLFDPGNNNFLNTTEKANFPPYGETFFKYPTGRFSDGRLIPDFVVTYLNRSLWRPYLEPGRKDFRDGANFASAAASVLDENNQMATLSLNDQVSYLKDVLTSLKQELGDAEAENVISEAIYLISMGGVDYTIFLISSGDSQGGKDNYVKMVIGNLTNAVKEIYEIGGRKFVFQNIAPLGCVPSAKQEFNLSANECEEEFEEIVIMHNNALCNVTEDLETQLPGFKYLIYDYYTLLLDRIQNPSSYGFKVADTACCGSGTYRGFGCGEGSYELCNNTSEYLFFDGNHPTEHGYYQLFDALWTGKSNATWPFSLEQLLQLEPQINVI